MSTIDVPKLIRELEQAGEKWADHALPGYTRDLCSRAAMALKHQHENGTQEIMHRLGLLLIELGKKLSGGNHG